MRITGLGRGKPSPNVACDEVETCLRIGIETKHSHKLHPKGWGSLLRVPPLEVICLLFFIYREISLSDINIFLIMNDNHN